MIIYDNSSWFTTVFSYTGSVWPAIRGPFVLWAIFVSATYYIMGTQKEILGNEGHTAFAGTMCFLLIFRANQSYARYWQGRTAVTAFFSEMRDFVSLSTIYMRGGISHVCWIEGRGGERMAQQDEDEQDKAARKLRVEIVRLTLAYVVSVKTFTRIAAEGYCMGSISAETKWAIDWDLFRLRQLLHDHEFRISSECLGIKDPTKRPGEPPSAKQMANDFKVHGGEPPRHWPREFEVDMTPRCRMHIPIAYLMRELLIMNMNDIQNTVPHGYKERFIPMLSGLIHGSEDDYETINQIITTPLPLPYASLCKTLLMIWMATFPFTVDYRLGIFGSLIIPILIIMALFGIDAIATELENPFGDDDNDLDILEAIHTLEGEFMEFLGLSGDEKAKTAFVWRTMPNYIARTSCKPLKRYLAFKELAADDFVTPDGPVGGMTPRSMSQGSDRSGSRRSASGSGSLISASSMR